MESIRVYGVKDKKGDQKIILVNVKKTNDLLNLNIAGRLF